MNQTDLRQLAKQIVHYSVKLQSDQNVLIEYQGPDAQPLAESCALEVSDSGGDSVMVNTGSSALNALAGALPGDIADYGKNKLRQIKKMHGHILIKDDADQARIDLSPKIRALYSKAIQKANQWRIKETAWVVIPALTRTLAAESGMTFEEFSTLYRDVCLADYSVLAPEIQPLRELMLSTKHVHIIGPGTDISFSIENIGVVACAGLGNLPDGECYTAPVKNSVNGKMRFGRSTYLGQSFSQMDLRFERGRITKAIAETRERTDALNRILDTDPDARYTGEFSFGLNPFLTCLTGNIGFDEKISGTVHLTPGRCYPRANNGNQSRIHWDMVHDQRPEHGGGKVIFDRKVVQENGLFVHPRLQRLNPDILRKIMGGQSSLPTILGNPPSRLLAATP